MKLLLLDDEPGLESLIVEYVHDSTASRVDTCADCLSHLQRECYDVLLLDYNLVNENGLVCMKEIQRRWPQLPIIVISGYPEEEVRASGTVEGVVIDQFLFKPQMSQMIGPYVAAAIEKRRAKIKAEEETICRQKSLDFLKWKKNS